jgi:hypothetical protein
MPVLLAMSVAGVADLSDLASHGDPSDATVVENDGAILWTAIQRACATYLPSSGAHNNGKSRYRLVQPCPPDSDAFPDSADIVFDDVDAVQTPVHALSVRTPLSMSGADRQAPRASDRGMRSIRRRCCAMSRWPHRR